jgi:hypothetical protein
MQKNTKSFDETTFFAAANGYSGFRSYFPQVFDSKKYDLVFVLKGGPGTGKSSLMRSVKDYLKTNGFTTESILCSSDPYSLDGVIAENERKRIAILDGTAPHTRDANVPGAIDEIVNLGDGWNDTLLRENKNLILELNKRKNSSYAAAYKHLALAGKISDLSKEIKKEAIDCKNLKSVIKIAADELCKDEELGESDVRLISSFGRFGKFSIDTTNKAQSEIIKVKDAGLASDIYMNALTVELKKRKMKITVFPSVFSEEKTEAIYLHTSKRRVILSESEDCNVFPQELFTSNPNIKIPKELSCAHDTFLSEAQKFFTFASDLHFELEKIYIGSMDFSKNEELLKKIIEKTKNI